VNGARVLGNAPLKFAPGDTVRIIGGAWHLSIGKLATVIVSDGHISTVQVHGDPGTLTTATMNLDIPAERAP